MILLYTGASIVEQPQPSYLKSLGGLVSNSIVPNNSLANLFSNVSLLAQERAYTETRAIILKNTSGSTVTNVTLYHTYPSNALIKLEWASVAVSNKQMEKITSAEDTPYYGNFSEPVGSGSKITLSTSMANGDMIGLWVRKTVLPNPAIAILDVNLEAYLAALSKSEVVDVFLEYT